MDKFKGLLKKTKDRNRFSRSEDFFNQPGEAPSNNNSLSPGPRPYNADTVLGPPTWGHDSPYSEAHRGAPPNFSTNTVGTSTTYSSQGREMGHKDSSSTMATSFSGSQGSSTRPGNFGYLAPLGHSPDGVPRTFTQPDPAELGFDPPAVTGHVISMPEFTAYRPERRPNQLRVTNPEDKAKAEERARLAKLAAEERLENRKQNASIENVRYVRQLIREKYRLDIYVWSKKGVQKAVRPRIEIDARKADAILEEIISIVKDWDSDVFDPEEWDMAEKIKESVPKLSERHVLWRNSPPWDKARLEKPSEEYYQNE